MVQVKLTEEEAQEVLRLNTSISKQAVHTFNGRSYASLQLKQIPFFQIGILMTSNSQIQLE